MKRRKGEQLTTGVVAEAILRNHFAAFAKVCFSILNPDGTFMDNWHIHALVHHLEQVRVGKIRRLIVNMPPRSLKSMLCSVAFPAWVIGLEPGKRIICASYSAELAGRLSNEFRTVVNHKRYRRIFPGMRISDNKNTEMEITTTQHGFRLATSVGGTLTGRGGNIVIIDDPLKPQDAFSEAKRGLPNDWFDHTVLSRLDDKRRDAIVIVMQRLHTDDLTGKLLAAERHGWTVLNLPAIAEQDERIPTGKRRYHRRRRGSLLHPEREPREVLDEMRARLGEANFQAQYQQNPMPADGNLIKREWVRRYKELPPRTSATYVIQSYDTASKEGVQNSHQDHKLSEEECRAACGVARYVRTIEESKALAQDEAPKIIISASGMATGGRVLYHLKKLASNPKNTILFTGFQAGGTRGAAMIAGVDRIKIHGEYVPVCAEVKNLDMLSAHADVDEIMRWLRGFKAAPRMTFVTHGEPAPADALRHRIQEELQWPALVPDHAQQVELA